jgi:hypothetical protein
MIKDCQAWSNDIFSHCNLGDKRLLNRLIKIGSCLASKVGSCLSACFKGGNTEIVGAYRFVRNETVKPDAIMEGICTSVAIESKNSDCLLAIEDTTSLSYLHGVKEELGYITSADSPNSAKGFLVHTVILYDPEKSKTLGIIDQNRWVRRSSEYGKHHIRKKRPYEEKESFKWEDASNRLALRMGDDLKKVISVCDREADIFAYLAYKVEKDQRFIVRAAQDRAICDENGVHISDVMMDSKVLGSFEVTVTQKGGRDARKAFVELRACRVRIGAPKDKKTKHGESIEVNVVTATEVSPPKEQKGFSWVLLTTEEIVNFENVRKIVRYYEKRWLIEEFHKCWKSGVKVENMRMQSADNLERMVTILAPIAIRLLQLRENLDQGGEEKSCLEALNEDEFLVLWRSIENKKKVPAKKPSLNWAYRAVAKLAGWNDSKRTGKACWSKLWEGWYLLSHRLQGYLISKEFA